MRTVVHADPAALGTAAAAEAAAEIRAAIAARGTCRLVVATGASQFATLAALTAAGIDWSRVHAFHLDEYVGVRDDHPASFRRYLRERFVAKAAGLASFTYIAGDAPDAEAECRRLGVLLDAAPIDVALVGIGENGHLAFNDPPADFTTERAYIVVHLDDACRRQQLGEGWFPSFDAVPDRAISMSIRRIMSAKRIVCSVPDARKAEAVRRCLTGTVSPEAPASILREHAGCTLHLDPRSAALLPKAVTAPKAAG